jgi:Mg2+ and Co2+ transporter CorA
MSQCVGAQTSVGQNDNSRSTLQPLAVLPSRYGETMDWTTVRADPLLVLQELFYFQTAAACQYLDMLRKLISGWTAQLHPTGDSDPTMEFIIHFEYTKTVLVRWSTHFSILLLRLGDQLSHDEGLTPEQRRLRQTSFSPIKKDIEYLQKEAETLIKLCESGKATIMSSFSVYASKRAQKESSLVTQLTKTTNRITLIFLPISLVTSVFGMNFKQLGQGPLSIILWVAVSVPLLVVCIFVSEWGGRSLRRGRSILFSETKH